MTKVLIADDHALVRAGLRQYLQETGRFSTIAEAASGMQVLDMLRGGSFDLLILDINMPDRGGLDILKHVRAGHPDVRVLILSAYPERQFCKLAAGQSVSEIANELSLSVKTVSTYRTRVLEKMCFKSNADITSYALRNGLMN